MKRIFPHLSENDERFVRAIKQGSGFSYDKRLDNPELVFQKLLDDDCNIISTESNVNFSILYFLESSQDPKYKEFYKRYKSLFSLEKVARYEEWCKKI